jgi:hypothetical protein
MIILWPVPSIVGRGRHDFPCPPSQSQIVHTTLYVRVVGDLVDLLRHALHKPEL